MPTLENILFDAESRQELRKVVPLIGLSVTLIVVTDGAPHACIRHLAYED